MYTSISKAIGLDYGINELVPVDEFVEKPISPSELIEKVDKLLKHKVGGWYVDNGKEFSFRGDSGNGR